MRVEVTQADIDNGLRENCRSCPVARALTRATGQPWQVHGDLFRLLDRTGDRGAVEVDLAMPPAVEQFVADFDRFRPVQPFAFDFAPPEAESCR